MKPFAPLAAASAALMLLGVGCFGQPAAPPTNEPPSNQPPAALGMWAEANGVVALDQRPGREVIVSSLIVEQNGWVVIHKDDGGRPGAVIGETYLEAGEHGQVTVMLREATVDGVVYYAMLHRDDGDRIFDISKDAAVQSTTLQGTIMASFEADADAGELPVVSP